MDQRITSTTNSATRRRDARIAKGYSLEDLAIATGLTVEEISAAEDGNGPVPEHHAERIEHALHV
jgi:transcriptional regulator with XRE-family HTH domain